MSFHRSMLAVTSALFGVLGLASYSPMLVIASNGFQPVSQDELKMTSEPLAPGAPAIILFREVDRDDRGQTAHEDNYLRIKVLTEKGRKYADVEIPFFKENGNEVVNVKGRTINPDGTISNFDGKIFEKSIAKAKGLKFLAKTFTLPNVQVGSILEYYYTLDLSENFVYDSHWILSDELFTKHAKFSLRPYTNPDSNLSVRWSWQGLPKGSTPPQEEANNTIRLEVNNIPAFQAEDYMPPENELKARVDFTYSEDAFEKDPKKYWIKRGKKLNGEVESFIGKHKAMEEAVSQIVAPSDPPDVKVQKIYARVQQMRNTSFEVRKTEQEKKREKIKAPSNVEDIWKKGYGDGEELTWLFLALVRAAGIEAYPVVISDRSNYFFRQDMMDARKLTTNLVLVKIGGKDLYCDPGSKFTPLGLLPWAETEVPGLQLDKNGGTWIQTLKPASSASRVERRAALSVSSTGDLEGTLTVTFTGLEAIRRRVEERNEDDTARKKFLEDQAKEYIPAASEVDLTNKPDWSGSSSMLVAEYKMKIPGWLSSAGRRRLFPVGIFSAAEKRVFDHADRTYPVYFEFPFEKTDDVTVTLPPGWEVSSLPPPEDEEHKVVSYIEKAEGSKQTLHLSRKLRVDFVYLDAKYYPALRNFFQLVRKGDEQQVVLQPGAASASN